MDPYVDNGSRCANQEDEARSSLEGSTHQPLQRGTCTEREEMIGFCMFFSKVRFTPE